MFSASHIRLTWVFQWWHGNLGILMVSWWHDTFIPELYNTTWSIANKIKLQEESSEIQLLV